MGSVYLGDLGMAGKSEKVNQQVRDIYAAMPKSVRRKGDGTVAELIVDEFCRQNRFSAKAKTLAAPDIRQWARNVIREHRLKTIFNQK